MIPSLEDMYGEEFMIEIVIQWTELEQYKRYLQIIFARVEKVAAHLHLENHSLIDICKTQFCDRVYIYIPIILKEKEKEKLFDFLFFKC